MLFTLSLFAIGAVSSAIANKRGYSCPEGDKIINALGGDGAAKFCQCQLALPTSVYVQVASPTSVSVYTLTQWTTTTQTIPTPVAAFVTTTENSTYTPWCYDATGSSGLSGLYIANFTQPADFNASTAIAARNAIPPYPAGRARLARRNNCDSEQKLSDYSDQQLDQACKCLWYANPVVTTTIAGVPYDVQIATESLTSTVTESWSEGTPTVTFTETVWPTAEQCATPTYYNPYPYHPWICDYLSEMILQDDVSGNYIYARRDPSGDTYSAGLTPDKATAGRFAWGLTLISNSNVSYYYYDNAWKNAYANVNISGVQTDALKFIDWRLQYDSQWVSPGMVPLGTYQDPLDCKYTVQVPNGDVLQLCGEELVLRAPDSSCTALGRLIASSPYPRNSTAFSTGAPILWRNK